MKKLSQQPTIDIKREELKKIVSDTLTELNNKMQKATQQLTEQIKVELNRIVTNLEGEIETKLNELKGRTVTIAPQQTQIAILDLPGVIKESKKKKKNRHPTPRDTEHNKELPPFWRRNFDYGESPYMNIGFIEKITDKPPYKKKKKKEK